MNQERKTKTLVQCVSSLPVLIWKTIVSKPLNSFNHCHLICEWRFGYEAKKNLSSLTCQKLYRNDYFGLEVFQ